MVTMAYTQSDIDALKKAMATGVKRVVFVSGETRREQEFHSLADMQTLLDRMEAEVADNTAGNSGGPAYFAHSRD